jgi:hypothetical protein
LIAGAVNTGLYGIVRMKGDGSMDPTFGTGGAAVVSVTSGGVLQLVVDHSGRILLLTTSSLLRFTPTGLPDPTFVPPVTVFPTFMTVRADDSITLFSYTNVYRIGTDGAILSTSTASAPTVYAFTDPYVDSSGRITYPSGPVNSFDSVTRVDEDGVPDTTFGGTGTVSFDTLTSFTKTQAVSDDGAGGTMLGGVLAATARSADSRRRASRPDLELGRRVRASAYGSAVRARRIPEAFSSLVAGFGYGSTD